MGKESVGSRSVDVLLIESSSDDADRFIEALAGMDAETDIHIVANGEEALEFIHRRGEYTDVPLPDFILLDFHLPDASGADLLKTLKDDPELRRLPVLVMMESEDEETIRRAYELNANAYIPKPAPPEEFDRVIKTIVDFWFKTALLPPKTT